jgi:DNA-binding Lrp family transcriptional regulator
MLLQVGLRHPGGEPVTSGEYDLLLKIYIEDDVDIGKYINERLLDIDGITRSLTTMTFKAF